MTIYFIRKDRYGRPLLELIIQLQEPDPSFLDRSNDPKHQDSSNASSLEANALKQSDIAREIKLGCVLLPKASFLFVSGRTYPNYPLQRQRCDLNGFVDSSISSVYPLPLSLGLIA